MLILDLWDKHMKTELGAWSITDPKGFKHRSVFDGIRWWGCDNLAHEEPMRKRSDIVNAVIRLQATMKPGDEREYQGYKIFREK